MFAIFGIMRDKEGFIYKGKVVNGKMHGQGKKYKKDGSFLYEGGWFRGKYQGKGREVKIEDGKTTICEGDWFNGKLHGKGKFTNPYVSKEGEWYDGKLHGKAKYTWKSGSEEGEFFYGDFIKGKRTNSDGEVKEGYFDRGLFFGQSPAVDQRIKNNKISRSKEELTEEEILILYFAGVNETTVVSMNDVCEYINQDLKETENVVKGLAAKGMAAIKTHNNETICTFEYGLIRDEFVELQPLEEQKWRAIELRDRVCP
jgi:hypothetical protein